MYTPPTVNGMLKKYRETFSKEEQEFLTYYLSKSKFEKRERQSIEANGYWYEKLVLRFHNLTWSWLFSGERIGRGIIRPRVRYAHPVEN